MKRCRAICAMLTLVLLSSILNVGSSATDTTIKKPDLTIALKTQLNYKSSYINDPNDAFRDLVRQYEQKTGKTVQVTFYSSEDDLNTKMNVELLSGGPDLISGTDISYWSLARRGAFADIAELIENDPDIDMDDFFPNIIDPFKDEEGRLFIMPCSYWYQFVMINNTLMDKMGLKAPDEWTMHNVMEICAQFNASDGIPADTDSFFDDSIYTSASDELMASIDFIKNTSYINALDDTVLKYLYEVPSVSYYTYWGSGLTNSNATLSHNLFLALTMDLLSLHDSAMVFSAAESYEVRNYPRSEYRAGEYLFDPSWAFCINNGGNTEDAWQFLKFLLSDKVQSGTIQSGYLFNNPVNKNAVEKRMDRLKLAADDLIESTEFKTEADKAAATDYVTNYMNRYFEAYTKTRDALTTPVLTDPILEKSLLSAIENMAGKNADLTEIRAEITRIIDVYMSETGGDIQSGYIVIYIAAAVLVFGGGAAGIVVAVRKRKKAKVE